MAQANAPPEAIARHTVEVRNQQKSMREAIWTLMVFRG
jgi:hypothetical protein